MRCKKSKFQIPGAFTQQMRYYFSFMAISCCQRVKKKSLEKHILNRRTCEELWEYSLVSLKTTNQGDSFLLLRLKNRTYSKNLTLYSKISKKAMGMLYLLQGNEIFINQRYKLSATKFVKILLYFVVNVILQPFAKG